MHQSIKSEPVDIFIGPRYTWGPIYGSACPSVTKSQSLVDLTDVSPVDEDANSILADDSGTPYADRSNAR